MGTEYRKKDKFRTYTQLDKVEALKALKKESFRVVHKKTGIPLATLYGWKKNPDLVLGSGNTAVLNPREERLLVIAIEYMGACGLPLWRPKLLDIIQSFIKQCKIKNPFKDGRPGRKWILGFEKRHKKSIRRRSREGLSKARIEGLTEDNVRGFFEFVYRPIYDKHGLKDSPWLLWNLDESGFQACRAKQLVYVSRRQKNAYCRQASVTKNCFTVLFCCNAAGQYLPPYTIFKGKYLMNTHVTGGFEGAGYNCSDSGWMMDFNFEAWLAQCFVPQTRERAAGRTQVLTFDGHNSRITYKTIQCAIDNNIVLIALPPNTSHALQPLAVGVFKSVKGIYSAEVLKWYGESGFANIDKDSFPFLLKAVWEKLDRDWALSGFKKTGLYPCKSDQVLAKIVLDPRDDAPLEYHRGPGNGTKSSSRMLIKTIGKSITPILTPRVTAVTAKKAATRCRVQREIGEVMTSPKSARRILEQEQAKAAKKVKGPANRAKAGPSGVSISIRTPAPKAAKSTPMRTLDSFITRTPRETMEVDVDVHQESLSQVQDDPTQAASSIIPIPLPLTSSRTTALSVRNRRESREDSIYRESSTTEDSDIDHPGDTIPTHGASNFPVRQAIVRKNLKNQSSHVIYYYEESFFPGLVIKRNREDGTITVKTMSKDPTKIGPSFWVWPEEERFRDIKFRDIFEAIKPPKKFSNRGNSYEVPRMTIYWR